MINFELPIRSRRSAGVPVTPEVHRLIRQGDAARNARNWRAAANAYRSALERDPDLAHIWVQYGHALKEESELAAAETAYRRAVDLAPAVGDTHLHLGHILKLQKRTPEAVSAYLAALDLAPENPHALGELMTLAESGVPIRSDLFRKHIDASLPHGAADGPARPPDAGTPAVQAMAALNALAADLRLRKREDADRDALQALDQAMAVVARLEQTDAVHPTGAPLVFDASDLIQHFRHTRFPTGIQRVQLEIICASLKRHRAPICALVDAGWIEIPADLFLELCSVALAADERGQPKWNTVTRRLTLLLATAGTFTFPRNAWLVALGTSWYSEYLLNIREVKAAYGVRYVPYVHDLIPVKRPDFCLPSLTQDYIAWLLDVFSIADAFFTNSESTRRDLLEAAEDLGRTLDPARVAVVRLDADFRKPGPADLDKSSLRAWGLDRKPYVLFVSTLEPRKNHMGAFTAWERLWRELGPDRTPKLVCVGSRGWMNESALAQLEASTALKQSVKLLSGRSDAELALLYRACLFTLYPSHYEGWGLPITESLSYGKLPLIADNSALLEAGAGLAEVFETDSDVSLLAALMRLVCDDAYRTAKIRRIETDFRPRSWADLAADLNRHLATWTNELQLSGGDENDRFILPIAHDRYYPIARNQATDLRKAAQPGALLRSGTDWHRLEDWGCWSRTSSLSLAARVGPVRSGRLAVYLGVKSPPEPNIHFHCDIGGELIEGRFTNSDVRWLSAILDWPDDKGDTLWIDFHSDRETSPSSSADGTDGRTIGPGAVGLYVCDAEHLAARLDMVEAITLGALDRLTLTAKARNLEKRTAALQSPPR